MKDPNLFDQPQFPVLPYAGTSGHSGSDTSEERARRQDGDGTTALRQRQTLRLLDDMNLLGLTWKELARLLKLHHGQASGVLSTLHKAGLIARLTDRRDRCHIYVLPKWVDEREVDDYRRNLNLKDVRRDLHDIQVMLEEGDYWRAKEFVDALLESRY